MDFLHRSVHLCRACAQGLAAEERGNHGHLFGYPRSRCIFHCPGCSICRIFQEADIRCGMEMPVMDLLSAYTEKPKSKTLRYIISGVALVLLIAAGLLYLSRYTTEKHTVARF